MLLLLPLLCPGWPGGHGVSLLPLLLAVVGLEGVLWWYLLLLMQQQLLPWRWRRLSLQSAGHVVQPQLPPALWWWLLQQQ